MNTTSRRDFLKTVGQSAAALGLVSYTSPLLFGHAGHTHETDLLFDISLAQYSLHRMIRSGKLDPLDFGPYTKKTFGIEAVEYWMGPYNTKGNDLKYLAEMKKRSDDAGVKGLLIMVDIGGELGMLGHPKEEKRKLAVEAHSTWIRAAKDMGCHSIRVNANSRGTAEEQMKLVADGLHSLSEIGAKSKINVIVENHGGNSSNPKWLSGVMKKVNLPNCGTLPDFGNFYKYDRYEGTKTLMPYAKAVSAKSRVFDDEGNEKQTDFYKMCKVVVDAGYTGYLGIEWEGGGISEIDGIKKTKVLLERVRDRLTKERAEALKK